MSFVDEMINDVVKVEGGYNNLPGDVETNFGITVQVARENGYTGSMKDMPVATARNIYKNIYIIKPGFDKIAEISEDIAREVIDTGVNMGVGTAAKFLQRSLNALLGPGHIVVDGNAGPATRKAISYFLSIRGNAGVKVLLKMLNSLQCARYIELVEQNAKKRSFIYGWVANRVNI